MTTVLYVKNESTQKETSGVKIIYKKDFVPELLGVFSLHIIHGHRLNKRKKKTDFWENVRMFN